MTIDSVLVEPDRQGPAQPAAGVEATRRPASTARRPHGFQGPPRAARLIALAGAVTAVAVFTATASQTGQGTTGTADRAGSVTHPTAGRSGSHSTPLVLAGPCTYPKPCWWK